MIYAQSIKDQSLTLNSTYSGFSRLIGIAFLDDTAKNIMVIEKNGNVKLIQNGIVQPHPILQFHVDNNNEHGLLGIETLKRNNLTYVYFYLTENITESFSNTSENLRNRIYQFQLENNTSLTNKSLLIDLPSTLPPFHVGGKILIGKDESMYAVIGDLEVSGANKSKLQNIKNGSEPDFTGSIFRINPINGSAVKDNPFIGIDVPNLDKTYGYGIRNSFGLTFDPVTGMIWDTENGPNHYDEINIVRPGFNSGWSEIMGPIDLTGVNQYNASLNDLVEFPNSHYSDPVMSWQTTIGITDIEFINASILGEHYENGILVGDYKNGDLYFFKLNDNRTGLDTNESVIDSEDKKNKYIIGSGFGGIVDIEVGPDKKIYIMDYKKGKIFTLS